MKNSLHGFASPARDAADNTHLCPELMEFVSRAKEITNERMLRLPEVKAKIGYAASTIWKAVNDGTLPPPVSIGPRTVAWRESELQAWIEANTYASRAKRSIDLKLFIKLLTAP